MTLDNGSRGTPIPALVLGGSVTALGVVRSLGPLGIPVLVACDPKDVAVHSRWASMLGGGLPEFSTTERLVEYLLSAPHERMVLIPCSDSWAESVAQLPPEVAARFPSYVSSLEVLQRLTDKERFAELVQRFEIPHPQTLFVHHASDLDRHDLARDSRYFLKARNSQQFIAQTGVKAYMVASLDEARSRVSELTAAGLGVVLQEYVPGPPSNHYFVDGFALEGGQVHARFARQRLRMHPPLFGNSTFLRTVTLEEVSDIVATVDRLIQASGLRGIFSVELKRDERTGVAKALEVNARPWWYVHYATTCGVNVCEMTYQAALGRVLPPFDGSYKVGRTCVYVRPDFRACRDLRREGTLSMATCVPQWLSGEHMIFSAADPMPLVHRCLDQAKSYLARLARPT